MKFDIDPIWPWSELQKLLGDLDTPTVLGVWLVGLLVLAIPIGLRYVPYHRHRQVLSAFGLLILAQLTWVACNSLSSSSLTMDERLRNGTLVLLLYIPLGLLGWMLRTYVETPGMSRQRFVTVVTLRLAAVACAIAAVTRPHLGFLNTVRGGNGVLKMCLDLSQSMTIQDEGGQARWEVLLRTLRECQPLLDRLRSEQGIDVEFYRFARETTPWDPEHPGQPDGKRTDIGAMLDMLYLNQDRRPVRDVIVLSDGRNNGNSSITPLGAARRWRQRSRVDTVLLGNPTTPNGLRDVSVTRVTAASSLIQARTNMVFQALIDAPGFEGSPAQIRVFVKGNKENKEHTAAAKIEILQREGDQQIYKDTQGGKVLLKDSRNNELRISMPAPEERGEYTVTVRVEDPHQAGQPLRGELNGSNNEASTLISVIPGGIKVLLIDRPRAWEPQMLYDVLRSDARINARVVWLGGNQPVEADVFQFSQKYDVIILGDVSAKQIDAAQPNAVKEIAKLVNAGSGLIMLGGYAAFGNEDWKGTPLAELLPLDLSKSKGLIERPIRMMPTEQGRRLLSLANGDKASEEKAWKDLPSLEQGIWRIVPQAGLQDNILATSISDDPILVSRNAGKSRVLAFAVDTTYFWRDTPEGVRRHSRFWRQIVAWLAHLDDSNGNVWVRPDLRDIPEGTELGFSVGARSKGGIDLPDGTFQVEIQTPSKKVPVNITRVGSDNRGTFKPDGPGEYVIRVRGKAHDPEGGEINDSAEARFLVREEDVEMSEWSADKGFMEKLAREGRGRAITIAQLPDLLRDYLENSLQEGKARTIDWPNWRSQDRSGFLSLFFVVFVALLAGEWYLRRRWGMI